MGTGAGGVGEGGVGECEVGDLFHAVFDGGLVVFVVEGVEEECGVGDEFELAVGLCFEGVAPCEEGDGCDSSSTG